ncbi:lipoprotein [Methylobacterium dankookense]|uniref:Lipoprotein n=1 Tax=Methylobacterium dankookense TaxID=560405 RepID=A0A564FU19_9HYPH|nr:lipoprotein [Methylobacterium dankookense]GJD57487.1 hypothetical protein IFDJLNFL_3390 [Methylobacterium dankookense]VUF11635.1 hypothetical protein MTDSW087_01319 [Methylobacterium dankookense]
MLPIRVLTILAATGLALTVSACGRRGALEAPQASAPQRPAQAAGPGTTASPRQLPGSVGLGGGSTSPDADAVQAGDELSASATPPAGTEAPIETSRGAKRGFRIPKDPFILDPLL